jgi:hypothetical protein
MPLPFFFYVRKYMWLYLSGVASLFLLSVLIFEDRKVMIFVRSMQIMIGISVLFSLRKSIRSVIKDDYRTIPADYWPEHVATWGIMIFWTGLVLNGCWLLFWQLVDIKFPGIRLAIANHPINGFFVLMIIVGGIFKFSYPTAYAGQLSRSARSIMTFVVLGTITLSSFGMYFSDSFQRFGNSIAEKLIVDWHIYMPKEE